MATCTACNSEILPGARWCGICHTNAVSPEVGKLASPGSRLGAYILDWILPMMALFMIIVLGGIGGAAGAEDGAGLGIFLGFLLLLGYVIWAFTLFVNGTTPGKRMLGMWVVKENGQRAGFVTMFFREWVGKTISTWIFSLGFVWILIYQDNQGWHDKLMSTYVVK